MTSQPNGYHNGQVPSAMMPAGAIQAGQYQMQPVLHNPLALQRGLAQTYIQEAKRRDHPLLRSFWANQNPLLRAVLLADDPTQAAHAMPESPLKTEAYAMLNERDSRLGRLTHPPFSSSRPENWKIPDLWDDIFIEVGAKVAAGLIKLDRINFRILEAKEKQPLWQNIDWASNWIWEQMRTRFCPRVSLPVAVPVSVSPPVRPGPSSTPARVSHAIRIIDPNSREGRSISRDSRNPPEQAPSTSESSSSQPSVSPHAVELNDDRAIRLNAREKELEERERKVQRDERTIVDQKKLIEDEHSALKEKKDDIERKKEDVDAREKLLTEREEWLASSTRKLREDRVVFMTEMRSYASRQSVIQQQNNQVIGWRPDPNRRVMLLAGNGVLVKQESDPYKDLKDTELWALLRQRIQKVQAARDHELGRDTLVGLEHKP